MWVNTWEGQTDKMDERSKLNLVDMVRYQKLNKEIRKMCKQAIEEWLNMQCDEIKKQFE